MGEKINMVGRHIGRLTVIEEAGRKHKEVLWKCKCECGNTTFVTGNYLRRGHTKSCGCLVIDRSREASLIHGLNGSRIAGIYSNMKTRCYNRNYGLFHRYGGRGITICDEWLGEHGLERFANWSLEHGYDGTKSIDRIDNDKGYSPENCRWVSMKEQQNNRSNNRIIEVDGVAKTMKQWSEYLAVHYATLQRHVKKGDAEEFIRTLAYG